MPPGKLPPVVPDHDGLDARLSAITFRLQSLEEHNVQILCSVRDLADSLTSHLQLSRANGDLHAN